MKVIYFFFGVSLTLSGCTTVANSAEDTTHTIKDQPENGSPEGLKTISPEEAKALLEKQKELVIVDVRTMQEYASGHVKNAKLINKYDPDFETQIKALNRNKSYLIYCASGGRSGETLQLMKQWGFQQVYDAKSYNALKEAGLPVEK